MSRTQNIATARIARITETFAAWDIAIIDVVQTMPKTAPKWFRVNIADHREIESAKAVADAVSQQYRINVACVAW